jgi:hypothetical protein
MLLLPSFLSAILLAPVQATQSPAQPPEARPRALWERVCAATASAAREPVKAFVLEADVLNRSGVQSNQLRIDFAYLAPDCVRFMLPSKNETGRFGPQPEQYWLRSDKEVVTLAGREYTEDRRKVDDMLALARNYVALSSPARLRVEGLTLPAAPPADLGVELGKRTKKLTWLAFDSPDFALVRGEGAREAPATYHIELGIREDGLPAVAIVRERENAAVEPLLVEFSKYEERDGFHLPLVLLVHVLDRAQVPASFAALPAQEVYVTSATLRPVLSVGDFKPKK